MVAPLVVAVADAVVAELNSHTWSVTFIAERRVLPEREVSSLTIPRVTVVPRSQECSVDTRGQLRRQITVDIGIQHHINGEFETDVPVDIALVDELVTHFLGRRLGSPPVVCTAATNDPVYVAEYLREMSLLTTIVSLTFEGREPMTEAPIRP